MARTLLISFFIAFSFGMNSQGFYEKYDIAGFVSRSDLTVKKKSFRNFKTHLKSMNYKFDYKFRKEYRNELQNYPDALHAFNGYRRKKISTYVIYGTTSLMIGGVTSAINFGDFATFALGCAIGWVGALPFTSILNSLGKTNFMDSLIIYNTESIELKKQERRTFNMMEHLKKATPY